MATEHQKTVIGGLLNAADPLSKKVISAYNPAVKYQTNLSNVRRFDAVHIEAAATLFGLVVRENDKKLYKNLKVLSDRVILKIEALFESTCTDCGEPYCNKLEDKPLLSCYLCLQGCHSCTDVAGKLELDSKPPIGTVWLCSGCHKKNDLDLAPSLAATAPKPVVDATTEVTQTPGANTEETEAPGDRVSPRRDRDDEVGDDDQRPVICEAYKRRECPHGLTGKRHIDGKPCSGRHPPRCFRYCKHGDNKKLGCVKGTDCNYYHPRLCRNSLAKRLCLNSDCTFVHLKFTRRSEDAREQRPDGARDKRPAPAEKTKQQIRFSSTATLGDTPYAPTIQKRNTANPERPKTDSIEPDTASFLLKLMENMKEGILLQLSDKLQEFHAVIPELVQKEQLKMNRYSAPPPPMFQLPSSQQMTYAQSAALQHPPAPNFLSQFPGCSY